VTVDAFQQLGSVIDLVAADHEAFAYPEAAVLTPILSDGASERNFVLQGSGLSARQARRSWVAVPTPDMQTIRGYSSSKDQVTLTEEDGTSRPVIVMDFAATQRFVGYWDVSARLVETADPTSPGS